MWYRNSLFLNTAVLIFSIHVGVLTGTTNTCKWTGRAKPKSHSSAHMLFLTGLWDLQLSSLPLRSLTKWELFEGPKYHPHKFDQLYWPFYTKLFIRIVADLSLKLFEITTGILRGYGKEEKNNPHWRSNTINSKTIKNPYTTAHVRRLLWVFRKLAKSC